MTSASSHSSLGLCYPISEVWQLNAMVYERQGTFLSLWGGGPAVAQVVVVACPLGPATLDVVLRLLWEVGGVVSTGLLCHQPPSPQAGSFL